MSLYDGFNGLQIGSGLNALHQGMAARNGQVMQGLGNALDSFVQNLQADNREKARKKSALDYLLGNGYTQEQAQQVTDTVGPEIVGQLMQRDWNKEDTEAVRKAEFEDWLKKNDISYKQAVVQSQFSQLMSNLANTKIKDWGNSRQGRQMYNADVKALQDFVSEHPEFANVIKILDKDDSSLGQEGYYDEDILEKLQSVRGDVDASEAYLKELKDKGLLTQRVLNNPYFADALDLLYQESGNDFNRLSPYLLLENTGKGDTAAGRQRKIDLEKFNNSVKAAKAALEKEAQKPTGEGSIPKGITPAILKEIKKDAKAYSRYKRLGGQG